MDVNCMCMLACMYVSVCFLSTRYCVSYFIVLLAFVLRLYRMVMKRLWPRCEKKICHEFDGQLLVSLNARFFSSTGHCIQPSSLYS